MGGALFAGGLTQVANGSCRFGGISWDGLALLHLVRQPVPCLI